MARIRLNREPGLVQRGVGTLAVGLVLAAFVCFAVAATVYDIGKWLAIW